MAPPLPADSGTQNVLAPRNVRRQVSGAAGENSEADRSTPPPGDGNGGGAVFSFPALPSWPWRFASLQISVGKTGTSEPHLKPRRNSGALLLVPSTLPPVSRSWNLGPLTYSQPFD